MQQNLRARIFWNLFQNLLRLDANPDDGRATVGLFAKRLSWLLSRIRTDLDNFGDVEAAALMLDGYLMIEEELLGKPSVSALGLIDPRPESAATSWHFGVVGEMLAPATPPPQLTRCLEVGQGRLLKPLRFLPKWLRYGAGALGLLGALTVLALALASGWGSVREAHWPAWLVVVCVLAVVVIAISYFATNLRFPLARALAFLVSSVAPALLAFPLWLIAVSQLLFNNLYLSLAGYTRAGCSVPDAYAPATSFSRRPTNPN